MPPQDVATRLRFLNEAGLATAASIPTTSAYIHASHDKAASANNVVLSRGRKREACPYCEQQIPPDAFSDANVTAAQGLGRSRASRRHLRALKLKGLAAPDKQSFTFVECERCSRKIHGPANVLGPRSGRTMTDNPTTSGHRTRPPAPKPNKTSLNQSQPAISKPSARNLKSKKPGLGNLLSEAKMASHTKDQKTLGLMDFMKKG